MATKEQISEEADHWFERNKEAIREKGAAPGIKYILAFLERLDSKYKIDNILEVGCCYGYNLDWLSQHIHAKYYGIDPSEKAIEYGKNIYSTGLRGGR